MWAAIITFIIEAVLENSFVKSIEVVGAKKKTVRFQKSMSQQCNKLLRKYADTSLDSGDFHQYIKSTKFKDFLFRFFNLSYDGNSTAELIDSFVEDAHKHAPKCQTLELRDFFNAFNTLYAKYLHKTIAGDVSLSALWSLISLNNRTFYKKVFDSEESIKRYMESYFSPKVLAEAPDLQRYHEICIKEFSKICFTGISGAETKASRSIDELYVENHFLINMDSIPEDIRNEVFKHKRKILYENPYFWQIDSVSDIFNCSNRIVLVGGAGYGKTTTANYVFCKFNELWGQDILRIKLNLKDYVSQIDKGVDFLDCLVDEVKKRTVSSKSGRIKETITEFLERGNALIIFDALDEIPSEALREKARLEISRFVDVYYLNKYIITTREVGYLRNRFESDFLHMRICPFDRVQIKEYAKLWYDLRQASQETTGIFKEFYKHFSAEAERSNCFELIQNPIILVLALIIFDAENNLPHKRVEFYKKCIDTFLNTREERKGAFEFTEKAKCILGDDLVIPKVAYHRYESLRTDPDFKLTKSELSNAILSALEISDKSSWRDAINLFTRYLIERTELIREIDEDIYDFSHKTFGEYFLACYFAKNIDNTELTELIKKWVGDPNRDELANLVIEIVIQQNQSQQHATVINMIFDTIRELSNKIKIISNHSEYASDSERLSDFLQVLYNIVNSGMLIPKFTDKLYELLVNDSDLLRNLRKNSSTSRFHGLERCPIDFDAFINLSAKKYVSDNHTVALLERYFNYLRVSVFDTPDEENDKLKKKSQSFLDAHNIPDQVRVFFDCVLVVRIINGNSNESPDIDYGDVNEFIVELRNHTELAKSEDVFLSLLAIMCNGSIGSDVTDEEFLHLFKFENAHRFANYIVPRTLVILLDKLFSNKIWFSMGLIAFVECTGSSGYYYLNWLEESGYSRRFEQKSDERIIENINSAIDNAKIFKSLYALESFDDFTDALKAQSVYDESFEAVYQRCYSVMAKYHSLNPNSSADSDLPL